MEMMSQVNENKNPLYSIFWSFVQILTSVAVSLKINFLDEVGLQMTRNEPGAILPQRQELQVMPNWRTQVQHILMRERAK